MIKPFPAVAVYSIPATQILSRVIEPKSALRLPFHATVERLILEGAVTQAVANDQVIFVALEVPKGEVWYCDKASCTFRFSASTSIDDVRMDRWQYATKGVYTSPADIDWNLLANPGFVQISEAVASAALTSHTVEWYATSHAGGNMLFFPVFPELSVISFGMTLNDATPRSLTVWGVDLSIRRIRLGDALLQELRNTSISDLELQRLLQTIASTGLLRTEVT